MGAQREMIVQVAVCIAGVTVPVSAATLVAVHPLPPLSEIPSNAVRSTIDYASLPTAIRDLLRGGGDQSPPSTVDMVVLLSSPEGAAVSATKSPPHSPMSVDGNGTDVDGRGDLNDLCDDDRAPDARDNGRARDAQKPQKVVLIVNSIDDLKSARVGTPYVLQFANLHRLADATAYCNIIASRCLIIERTRETEDIHLLDEINVLFVNIEGLLSSELHKGRDLEVLQEVLWSARMIRNKAKLLGGRAKSVQKWPGSAAVNRLRRVISRILDPKASRTVAFLSGRVSGLLDKIHEAQEGAIEFS